MNGPAHYAAAERLLAGRTVGADDDLSLLPHYGPSKMDLRAAQVHATLALAAAHIEGETAGPAFIDGLPVPTIDNFDEWQLVTS